MEQRPAKSLFNESSAQSDDPPTVGSTMPANNETNVGVSAGITVTFSEPADVSGAWFEITGTVSGSHSCKL